ncbi:cytochrome P450 709B1-like [Tasmannia lanceolata]|uniref:cytochrome P450 709B1-like n=1 Tax=Tasmannia lanceolata TaxID=3420 RepID=UPI0040646989
MEMSYLGIFQVVLAVLLISRLWKVFNVLLWRPYSLKKCFAKQGIRGPSYSFMSGSLEEIKSLKKNVGEMVMDIHCHDFIPRVLPHYYKWSSQYGERFLYFFGTQPRICITEPELAKELLSNKFGFFTKPKPRPTLLALLGKGLGFTDGLEWVKHRRALNPAFSIDKLKVMTKAMAACTSSMLDRWQDMVIQDKGHCKEIEMHMEFEELTADIICHTAFGKSFNEGRAVFEVQKELQKLATATSADVFIPGSQYLPTRRNLHRWELNRRVRNIFNHIIESRLNSKDQNSADDLLGWMMGISDTESDRKQAGPKLNMTEIMNECKTFFFAGHETTANLLTWTIFLLSVHQEWQGRLREEVLRECGMEIPDAEKLSKLKLVNMVLLEALRLYGPVILLIRKASRNMMLGKLMIPKDTHISIPLQILHRNKKYWGEDANEFNPLRFADGISRAAKHPNALMPFSIGPRVCIGQNFAMLEAKTVLSMILQRFSFTLSPQYKHAPTDNITLQPKFGLPVILSPLHV